MKWIKPVPTLLVFTLLMASFSLGNAAPLPQPDLPKAEIMRLGEQMYRNGILPSGKAMTAFIRSDIEVDSSVFSCSSCHLRAGLGSFEGGVITPPTTGNKLYQKYRRPPSLGDSVDQTGRYIYAKTVQERPPYNRETLANAIRFGTDPSGQTFNDVMPRYPLSDSDLSILIAYLELLSSTPSQGASSQEFKFATIITDDVSQKDREALLGPLQQFIAQKNQQLKMYVDFKKFGYTPTAEMKYAFRRASLDIWVLKGSPETWPAQLTAYIAANPVFAVLGGISNSDWQPIHNFCEEQRLPCLFPITDFPPLSEDGWYSYYFNKGYAQEGEAVAKYLNQSSELSPEAAILEIVQDSPTGKALSAGFQKSWLEKEHPATATVTLSTSQLRDQSILDKLLKQHNPKILLLWADEQILPQLSKLVAGVPKTGMVFVSSSYLGKQTAAIDESLRNSVYITYPYRLTPYVGSKVGGFDSKIPIFTTAKDFGEQRISSRTIAMLQQATLQGLNLIYDNLYRDHLLDVMSMQMDRTVRDYERFSFGPGQRYVSKGCYIIQLGSGREPALIPRSEWVIP